MTRSWPEDMAFQRALDDLIAAGIADPLDLDLSVLHAARDRLDRFIIRMTNERIHTS